MKRIRCFNLDPALKNHELNKKLMSENLLPCENLTKLYENDSSLYNSYKVSYIDIFVSDGDNEIFYNAEICIDHEKELNRNHIKSDLKDFICNHVRLKNITKEELYNICEFIIDHKNDLNEILKDVK